jgi:glycosyltransferase involved in cell wall biosynthesis
MSENTTLGVLFLCDHLGYARGVVHGVTTYYQQVLPRLARKNVRLKVCFLRQYHDAAQTLMHHGVSPAFFRRRKWDPRALSDVMRTVRQQRLDVIHAAGMKSMLLARLAARLTGARCVIHIHDAQKPMAPVGLSQRHLAPWTDAAIGVSNETCRFARAVMGIAPHKVHRLHNAVDLTPYDVLASDVKTQVRGEVGIEQNVPLIGLVGRLAYQKDPQSAIQQLQSIREHVPNSQLLLVGDGPDRAACEAFTEALNLNEAVHFAGQRRDMPRMLSALDVLMMPSRWEGLPFVGIEAMAAGLPIVAYDVGGLSELIHHGTDGLLVAPGDEKAMTQQLIALLSDADWHGQLSAQARRRSREFGVDQHVQHLLALYNSITEPSARRSTREAHEPVQANR